jgi:predicted nucleic acid-binding protein
VSTFVDTSVLLALLDADQPQHARAAAAWRALLAADESLFATSYVLVETYALVQRRLGFDAVRTLTEDIVPLLAIEWIDEATHTAAVAALLTAARRGLSLVDCTSFLAMRRRGATRAFALDADFEGQGFTMLPAGNGSTSRD